MEAVLAPRFRRQLPEIRIAQFCRPLDQLLLLVRAHEIPVREIWLSEVARQVLEQVEQLEIDTGCEAAVVVATLIKLKTRALLGDLTGREEIDPAEEAEQREQLLTALEEAREMARSMSRVDTERFERREARAAGVGETEGVTAAEDTGSTLDGKDGVSEPELQGVQAEEESSSDREMSLEEIGEMLAGGAVALSVPDPISVEQAADEIAAALKEIGAVSIERFLTGELVLLITFFLAALELVRMRLIVIRQDAPFGELWLEPAPSGASGSTEEARR